MKVVITYNEAGCIIIPQPKVIPAPQLKGPEYLIVVEARSRAEAIGIAYQAHAAMFSSPPLICCPGEEKFWEGKS